MNKNAIKYIVLLTLLLFSAGILAGAASFFYLPENIIDEVINNFDITLNVQKNFKELFQANFSAEIIWVIIIWLLGNMRFTSLLSVGVVGIRGFFLGFGASFVLLFCDEKKTIFLGSILPQSAFALTSLTVLCILSIRIFIQNREPRGAETSRLVMGALFFIVTALVAAIEAGCSMFINM